MLERAGVRADGVQRLARIVMQAELDAVICSGARRGKQFTYALLDERVPAASSLARDEALAELGRRYFISHGPAQVRDFAWWSGLRAADARASLEMVAPELAHENVNGRTYWFSPTTRAVRSRRPIAYLLPVYDEYLIAYKDRSAALDLTVWKPLVERHPFIAPIVVDGKVVGGWRRVRTQADTRISVTPLTPFDSATRRAVNASARAYATFLGLDA